MRVRGGDGCCGASSCGRGLSVLRGAGYDSTILGVTGFGGSKGRERELRATRGDEYGVFNPLIGYWYRRGPGNDRGVALYLYFYVVRRSVDSSFLDFLSCACF